MVPVTVKVGLQTAPVGTKLPLSPTRFDVCTIFVDNFVDNGILMPGNHRSQTWHCYKPGKNSQLFLFKINDLKNAS